MQLFSSSATLNSALETWFIQNNLLDGSPYLLKTDTVNLSERVIGYLELFKIDEGFLKQVHQQEKKVVLIHMGDEFGKKDVSAYSHSDLILRNYFFADLFSRVDLQAKLLWIPNGFRTGVGPRNPNHLLEASSRSHLASFMGWIHNPDSFQGERDSFASALRAVRKTKGPRFRPLQKWFDKRFRSNSERITFSKTALQNKDIYLLSSGGFGSGNQVGLYSAILENSIFAPCPAGNSPETIRLYDALECGCIPISLSHEFITSPLALARFGTPPFPLLASWGELPDFLAEQKKKLNSNPDDLLELQQQCVQWWSHYKVQIAILIQERIAKLAQSN